MGRWVVILFILSGVVSGTAVYKMLKQSNSLKSQASAQMTNNFYKFAIAKVGNPQLLIESSLISLSSGWNIELHDKKIFVETPLPSAPFAHFEKAKKEITNLVSSWLANEFPREKNIELEVQIKEL